MMFDIAVIGGGPAGVSAALMSARQGMKTVLCADRPVLGGNSSSEIRVWTRGATGGGNLFAEEMGTLGQLKLNSLATNPNGNVFLWDETLLDAVLSQPLLTLYLNLPITEVYMASDGTTIRSIAGYQMASGLKIELNAKMYIDCTGDGEVAYRAGIPYRMGHEASSTYDEDMACEMAGQEMLGCSILWQTKRVGHVVPFVAPSYAYSLEKIESMIQKGGRIVTAEMQGSDCWWFEFGGCLNTIDEIQEIHLELRRIVMGLWNYIKNSGRFDADELQLEWIGALPGKRESRRFQGCYTLTQKDIENNRFASCAVAYGGWFMDAHPAQGIFSKENNCVQPALSCYGIPIDCFFHPQFPNILFCGRAASMSHQAFTSSRVMNTCGLTGDACAMAATLCIRNGVTLVQLAQDPLFLINSLAREDVIFDVPLPAGVLQDAQVWASSEHLHASRPDGMILPLRGEVFVSLPAAGQKVVLYFQAQTECNISYHIDSQKLPSRMVEGPILAKGNWRMGVGQNRVEVFLPGNDHEFCTIRLTDQPSAAICLGEWLCGVCAGTKQEISRYAPAVEWDGRYKAAEVLSGFSRPYQGANGWMATSSKAKLKVQLCKPQVVKEVRLYFDPEFCSELTSSWCNTWAESHHYCAREGMPAQLVRSYRLYADRQLVGQADHNKSRMAIHSFSPRYVSCFELEILDTYGGCAVLYRMLVQ